jgi:hypothetical protein
MATFPIKSFAGGKTDFPIGADPSQFETADNLVINQYRVLEQRPGTTYDFTSAGTRCRMPTNKRIGMMAPQFTGTGKSFTVLKQSSTKLFYDNGTARVELVGPAGASAFNISSLDDTTAFSYGEWNEHTYITHESPWQIPVKVYRDGSGVLQLRTAGLPPLQGSGITATGAAGTATYLYAFVYKYSYTVGGTQYDTRSRPYLNTYGSLPTAPNTNNITINNIPALSNATGEHYDTANITVEIYRTTNNGIVFYYVGAVTNGTTSYVDSATDSALQTANNTIYTTGGVLENDRPPKTKYVHSTSDFTFYGNGYEVLPSGADGGLFPQRMWQSKRGSPDSVPAANSIDIEEPITGVSSIQSIPIVFGANSIYRIDGTFDDLGRGGLFPRKISDKVGCVGHNSIIQTLDGIYIAGNDGFYFCDGYKIYSLSAEDFKESYARMIGTTIQNKRLCGAYDALNKRVLWAGYDDTGDTSGENNIIYCMYLPVRKFTTWSSGYTGTGPHLTLTGTANGTAQLTFVSTNGVNVGDFVRIPGVATFNLFVKSVDSATQLTLNSTVSAGATTCQFFFNTPLEIDMYSNFQPSSLLYAPLTGTLYQGDGRGFTLQYGQDTLSDVQIDERISSGSSSAVTPTLRSIYVNYAGPVTSLGTSDFRKWVNKVLIKVRPRGDISSQAAVQPYGENNSNGYQQPLQVVLAQGFYPWGSIAYGDPRLYRRRSALADTIRRFPKNSLRCEYKQLILKTGFVNLFNSDSYGLANGMTANGDGTYTFHTTTTIVDYLYNSWASFASVDGYVTQYKILAQSDNSVTIAQGAGAVPTNGQWIITAYPVNNFINLIEYSFTYEVLGQSQTPFTSTPGTNAT